MSINEKLVNLVYFIIAIINFILIIFGTLGNLFTFTILIRKHLRANFSYTRYLLALCIVDTCCLYNWNFTFVYQDILTSDRKRIEFLSPISCRIFSYFAYSTLQLSSWIMCAIGIDRIILLVSSTRSLHSKSIKSTIKNETNISRKIFEKLNPFKSTAVVVSLLTVFTFATNLVVLINNATPFIENFNNTNLHLNDTRSYQRSSRTFTCYSPVEFFKIWDIYHVFMYSLIPFVIIFIQNLIVAYFTVKQSNRLKLYKKNINKSASSNSFQQPRIILSPEITTSPTTSRKQLDIVSKTKSDVKTNQIPLNHTKNSPAPKVISASATDISSINTVIAMKQISNTGNSNQNFKLGKKMSSQSKGSYVKNLLIFLTLSFFFTTLPYSLLYAINLNDTLTKTTAGNIVKRCLLSLQYLRHSTNFLIYILTSTIIQNEIKTMFNEIRAKLKIKSQQSQPRLSIRL